MDSNVSVTQVNNISLFEKARNAANHSIASSQNIPLMRMQSGNHSPLSLLQKKLLQKEEHIHFNPKEKIPHYIMSPFPLNWMSQDQNSLSLTDMSFTYEHDLYKDFPKSPQQKKEIFDTLQKKRRDDIELILTNMQELSSLAKAPLKSKQNSLNRSLEVPRNAFSTLFENVKTIPDQEKVSPQLDDSLTLILKKKSPLRNHYRRKSCYCNWCGGMSHLEQEIQNNPCIPVTKIAAKGAHSKSKKGFDIIKSELGHLLSISKKPSFSSKQTPTNKKFVSRMQVPTQEVIKSVKVIKEEMSEQPKGVKNDDVKERKKDVSIENTLQASQQGISLKKPQPILDKPRKSNLLQLNHIENVHSPKQSQTKIQLSINGSPKNFAVIKSLSPNPIDRRQSNNLIKQRSNIGGVFKNLEAKRLRTDHSNNKGSVLSISQRNLSVTSETPRKGSPMQRDVTKGSLNVSQNKMPELPSFHKKQQDSKKLIIIKQKERTTADINFSDIEGQARASIKNHLKNIVTSPTQESSQLDNHDLNVKPEDKRTKKRKSHAKKKLTDLMSDAFKGRNQTVLNVYLSSTTTYPKNPNARMETNHSHSHSKDFRDTTITEGPKKVGSPEIYLRRLIDCKKKKANQRSNIE